MTDDQAAEITAARLALVARRPAPTPISLLPAAELEALDWTPDAEGALRARRQLPSGGLAQAIVAADYEEVWARGAPRGPGAKGLSISVWWWYATIDGPRDERRGAGGPVRTRHRATAAAAAWIARREWPAEQCGPVLLMVGRFHRARSRRYRVWAGRGPRQQ